MSEQAQTPAAEGGMTVHDVLSAKVYLPRFLQKCASRGVVPTTQEEAKGLLDVAQNVRLYEMKAAAAGKPQGEPSFIEKAAAASHALLGEDAFIDPTPFLRDPDVVAAFEAGGIYA